MKTKSPSYTVTGVNAALKRAGLRRSTRVSGGVGRVLRVESGYKVRALDGGGLRVEWVSALGDRAETFEQMLVRCGEVLGKAGYALFRADYAGAEEAQGPYLALHDPDAFPENHFHPSGVVC